MPNDPKDVGESTTRKGENIVKEDGKEAGRRDAGHEGGADRPVGTSTPRDQTGVAPEDDADTDRAKR